MLIYWVLGKLFHEPFYFLLRAINVRLAFIKTKAKSCKDGFHVMHVLLTSLSSITDGFEASIVDDQDLPYSPIYFIQGVTLQCTE